MLKVGTTGSQVSNDLKPIIADFIPKGVTLNVLDYFGDDTAIIKLSWSNHPYVVSPTNQVLTHFLSHPSIISEVTNEILNNKYKTQIRMKSKAVTESTVEMEDPDKKGKTVLKQVLTRKKDGLQAEYICKVQGKYKVEYVLDEG